MHTFEFIRPADSAVAISAAAQSKTAQNATAKLYPREFDAARNFVVRTGLAGMSNKFISAPFGCGLQHYASHHEMRDLILWGCPLPSHNIAHERPTPGMFVYYNLKGQECD